MQITDTTAMEWERLRVSSRNMRTSRKMLREGEALPGTGLYAIIVKLHEGQEKFTAPRHRHNFAQIRLGIRGHMDFGPGLECDPGEVGFFPGGAYYGPEEIEGAEYLLLQWGRDWVTREQDKQAIAELGGRGRFDHGMYYYTEDGVEKEMDGKRAVWQHVYGRPEVIHEPRYRGPIMMTPDNFDWLKGDGVSHKTLGRFTEDDVVVSMVRWNGAGSAHSLSDERTWLAFVLAGAISVEGQVCGPETAIWSEFAEAQDLVGDVGTEVMIIGFPTERPKPA
jgi:hypothetical protein